jgi:hypothetical protein
MILSAAEEKENPKNQKMIQPRMENGHSPAPSLY